jgi:hypothetical protein
MAVGKGKLFCQYCKKSMFLDHFIQKIDKNNIPYYRCSIYEKEINSRPVTYRCRCHDRKHFTEEHFIKIILKNGKLIMACKENYEKNGGKLNDGEASRKALKKKFEGYIGKDGFMPKSKEYFRNSALKIKYGITLEEFNTILKQQNYCCEICGKHQDTVKKSFHIDHNHKTKDIRGILCNKCNMAIGLLQEDLLIFDSAIKYLQKYKK